VPRSGISVTAAVRDRRCFPGSRRTLGGGAVAFSNPERIEITQPRVGAKAPTLGGFQHDPTLQGLKRLAPPQRILGQVVFVSSLPSSKKFR
jgi:hypothetical protein